jgi:hypothetical protein
LADEVQEALDEARKAQQVEQKREARRHKLKLAAKLRAEINFRHALERVDHRIDVIEPAQDEVDRMLEEGKTLEITAGD